MPLQSEDPGDVRREFGPCMSRIVTESKALPKRLAQAYARQTITMTAGAKDSILDRAEALSAAPYPATAASLTSRARRSHSAAFSRHVLTRWLTLGHFNRTNRQQRCSAPFIKMFDRAGRSGAGGGPERSRRLRVAFAQCEEDIQQVAVD